MGSHAWRIHTHSRSHSLTHHSFTHSLTPSLAHRNSDSFEERMISRAWGMHTHTHTHTHTPTHHSLSPSHTHTRSIAFSLFCPPVVPPEVFEEVMRQLLGYITQEKDSTSNKLVCVCVRALIPSLFQS